jgi:hypothetical protein
MRQAVGREGFSALCAMSIHAFEIQYGTDDVPLNPMK